MGLLKENMENQDTPILTPLTNIIPKIEDDNDNEKEETKWNRIPDSTINDSFQEGLSVPSFSSTTNILNGSFQLVSSMTASSPSISKCSTTSFNGIIQQQINNLAEVYVDLLSFGDYDKDKYLPPDEQENKTHDINIISKTFFSLVSLPFTIYITYNLFFILCYSNKVNVNITLITENDFYNRTFLWLLNIEPYFIKPLLIYFFELTFKPLLTADLILNSYIKNFIGSYIPDIFQLFVFYFLFSTIYSLENSLCAPPSAEDTSNTLDLNTSDSSENDLCGDELKNPNPNPLEDLIPSAIPTISDDCDPMAKCKSNLYSGIKTFSIVIITIFWIIYAWTFIKDFIYNHGIMPTSFVSYFIVFFITVCLLFYCAIRLIIPLYEPFLEFSASTILFYLFLYTFFGILIFVGYAPGSLFDLPNILSTVITAMDKYMETGSTTETKVEEISKENASIPVKIFSFIRKILSRDKISLLCLFIFIAGLIQSALIKSFNLRISSSIFFTFLAAGTCIYKAWKFRNER